ncbi:TetR family transcriptional regulator [Yinghuangia seranimata]|uniref:TetR family transcriptional regulator n=1 Tax=Yinghuangia seranimata TaxID=408067 RepID=UPI00248BC72C|nr:TetR family transcriptional regulator [Yinghuangia seranimata]MDI2128838.1 TetR family transcriptional regulator [Yinghuangia seranimata]
MTSKASAPDTPRHPMLDEPPLSLRERKKRRTREAIRREAYRLFRDQGFDETTVEEIAEAAEVSPSTFFRYFPTKEDVVLTDEYDPLIIKLMREGPADATFIEMLRGAVLGPLRVLMEAEREEMVIRMQLMVSVPSLRKRSQLQQTEGWRMLSEAFAERTGKDPADPRLRYAAAAIGSALNEAMLSWAEDGCEGSPADRMEEALDFVETGLRTF